MDNDGNLGVTEARFGLTLLTCLLVAIGYIALHRLGGTGKAPTVEPRREIASRPTVPGSEVPPDDEQPQVLPIDPQAPDIRTSHRPERIVPEQVTPSPRDGQTLPDRASTQRERR